MGSTFAQERNTQSPVPQTHCQSPIAGSLQVGMSQCALGSSPPLGLARTKYCSHMFVILCGLSDSQINTSASCIRGR